MARAGIALAPGLIMGLIVLPVGFAAIGGSVAAAQTAAAQTGSRTSLTVETSQVAGHTVATFTATVLGEDNAPATGAVTLMDQGKPVSGAALNSEGKTVLKLDSLTPGEHTLTAAYNGDNLHAASESENVVVHPEATAPAPDFSLGINPATLSLTAGASGTVIATVAPVTGTGFTGFISLSCSGLPAYTACTFSPANLQITSKTPSLTSSMSLQTTGNGGTLAQNRSTASPLVLAVMLPGVLGLGLLGRKRKLLGRVALLALIGVISILGTTACSARYDYLNHGPQTLGTGPGTFTITVTAQTSDGVNATEHSQTLALTVK
ncbi:Ig-like domain-containing protein [Acidicapsa ligni]|uniref:Ig-like domain-containing protein n=1 Tax=Acidicapsa ligni TaxID=542300 RepID=UPI0021DF5628|nr:Ig-like domain-containing protein [Acidicapsa ligni]